MKKKSLQPGYEVRNMEKCKNISVNKTFHLLFTRISPLAKIADICKNGVLNAKLPTYLPDEVPGSHHIDQVPPSLHLAAGVLDLFYNLEEDMEDRL